MQLDASDVRDDNSATKCPAHGAQRVNHLINGHVCRHLAKAARICLHSEGYTLCFVCRQIGVTTLRHHSKAYLLIKTRPPCIRDSFSRGGSLLLRNLSFKDMEHEKFHDISLNLHLCV